MLNFDKDREPVTPKDAATLLVLRDAAGGGVEIFCVRRHAKSAFMGGVVVFPGGDYEVFRPWTERNQIEFGGRKGFIVLALSAGVPVVPIFNMCFENEKAKSLNTFESFNDCTQSGLDSIHWPGSHSGKVLSRQSAHSMNKPHQ